MPGRNKREHYDFTLGALIESLETTEVLGQAAAQVNLARFAVKDAERARSLARLVAAEEAISELRRRNEQLRLW